MEKLTIVEIKALCVTGADADGIEIPVVKYNRIGNFKVGDVIEGYFLNDDDDLDDFYFEAVRLA